MMFHQSVRSKAVTVIHGVFTNAVEQVMNAMHTPVYFETYKFNGNTNPLPREVVDSIRKNKVCLNGRPETLPSGARKELGIFASLVNCSWKNIDVAVIRESTEGEYTGHEHQVVPGVIGSFKVTMTKFWSDRIANFSFEFAQLNERKKVTSVHSKGMKIADAFFLESCQEVAKMHPDISYNEISADNCCLQLVEKPEQFDIIVTPNLFGNLIANVATGVAGGGSGGNFGAEYAVFEQVGTVGNSESPVALLLSSVMMLRHLQLPLFANRLETATRRVISEGKCGSNNTTTQGVVDAVIANL